MRMSVRLTLVALAASFALAAAVGAASAGRLSTSNQFIRATWRSLEFVTGFGTIRCPVTLEGSLHSRTIAKVARALIGAITEASVNQASCSGAAANSRVITHNGVEDLLGVAAPQTLPWHLTYESFAGTLPRIEKLNLLLNRFRFSTSIPTFGLCDYVRSEDSITFELFVNASGVITTIIPREGSNRVKRVRVNSGSCVEEISIRAPNGELFLLNTTRGVTILLI